MPVEGIEPSANCGSGDGSLIRPEIRKETTKQNHKRVMRSGSWIQATGPNNGHQLRDYSKSSNRSENRPLIYQKGAAPSLGCCSLNMTNQKL